MRTFRSTGLGLVGSRSKSSSSRTDVRTCRHGVAPHSRDPGIIQPWQGGAVHGLPTSFRSDEYFGNAHRVLPVRLGKSDRGHPSTPLLIQAIRQYLDPPFPKWREGLPQGLLLLSPSGPGQRHFIALTDRRIPDFFLVQQEDRIAARQLKARQQIGRLPHMPSVSRADERQDADPKIAGFKIGHQLTELVVLPCLSIALANREIARLDAQADVDEMASPAGREQLPIGTG